MRRNVRATQGSSENRQAEEDLPGIVSKLLAQIGVPITVATLKECVPAIWVALYEGLFQVRIPGLLRGPPASTEQGRLHNVRLVIGELSKTVLRTDLSHIIPSKVVRGDTATVANLIQIFRELGRVVERGSENLNERAADRSGLSREAAGNSEGAFESEEDYETDDAPGSDPETDDLDHDDDENDQPAGIPSNSSGHYAETLEHELDISGISEVAPESQFDSDEDLAPPPPGISHSPPKKRRRRAGSATDIATTVTDDISEYLQSQGNEATSTSGRTRNANTSLGTSLRREKSSVSHREQPVGTRRKATPTKGQSLLKLLATDTPYTRALKRRRLNMLRAASHVRAPKPTLKTKGQTSREPPKPTVKTKMRNRHDDSGDMSSFHGSSPRRSSNHAKEEFVPAEAHLEQFEREVEETLPAAASSTTISERTRNNVLGTWEKALDDRLWKRKVKKQAAVGQAIDELRPLKHLAESTASDFLRRQQHKENATLQSGRAAQQERRRRLAAMEKQKREAEELVERYNIKLRNKDEQLVKFLYEDYQRKQREAIIEGRKLQKESESALISEIKKKQQAKEKFYRDQLEILTERLKETEKEEDLILKAHAEEKRKLIREHKQSAKVHISRMKEKLEVDVNDIVFREADARQLSADTVFGYRRA